MSKLLSSSVLSAGLATLTWLAGCTSSGVTADPGTPGPDAALPGPGSHDAAPPGTPDATPPGSVPDAGPACRNATGASVDLVEDRTVYDQDGRAVLEMSLTVSDLVGLASVDANAPNAVVNAIFTEGTFGAGALQVRGHGV